MQSLENEKNPMRAIAAKEVGLWIYNTVHGTEGDYKGVGRACALIDLLLWELHGRHGWSFFFFSGESCGRKFFCFAGFCSKSESLS